MVAHSHMEAGWQLTPQEYYNIKASKVFTAVVSALSKAPQRRFTHAEVYFFEKWYSQQPQAKKEEALALIKQGRFEFVNGGWVVSDELCPTFE